MAFNKNKTQMKDAVQNFCSITGATEEVGLHYLDACNGDLNAAINMQMEDAAAGVETIGSGSLFSNASAAAATSAAASDDSCEDSDASRRQVNELAERLQCSQIRAPIPQRKETLVEENYVFGRHGRRRKAQSVFDGFRDFQAEARQQVLALNHTSSSSSGSGSSDKRSTLEDLFRPPLDLLYKGSFETAKETGVVGNKWLIVNVQNVQEFACQVLNRDIWSNPKVKEIVKHNFIFWQVYSDSVEGQRYMNFYKVREWPYVAVLDPRTGEKLVEWSKIDLNSFCEFVGEFLCMHQNPNESTEESPPAKKSRSSGSILDASEESQLNAALSASLQDNTFKVKSKPTEYDLSDNENDFYSSADDTDDDLETFSDSNDSKQLMDSKAKQNCNQSKFSSAYNDPISSTTVVSVTDCSDNHTGSERKSIPPETPPEPEDLVAPAELPYEKYLGSSSDLVSKILLRYPNGDREQLSLPCTSKLMYLVSYVEGLGYPRDDYELITTFPKRQLSVLDLLTVTLRDSGLFPQETVFVQLKH